MKTKFEPRQDQAFDNTKETADAYHKRGGVTHFVSKDQLTALCRSKDGHVGFNRWRFVNCVACFRLRRAIRLAATGLGKANHQPDAHEPRCSLNFSGFKCTCKKGA